MIDDHLVLIQVGRIGDHFDHSEPAITRSLDESLTHLRTDYVDLLIAHDIGIPYTIIHTYATIYNTFG